MTQARPGTGKASELAGSGCLICCPIAFRIRHVIINDGKSFDDRRRLWRTAARTITLPPKAGRVAPRTSPAWRGCRGGLVLEAADPIIPQLSATSQSDVRRR